MPSRVRAGAEPGCCWQAAAATGQLPETPSNVPVLQTPTPLLPRLRCNCQTGMNACTQRQALACQSVASLGASRPALTPLSRNVPVEGYDTM